MRIEQNSTQDHYCAQHHHLEGVFLEYLLKHIVLGCVQLNSARLVDDRPDLLQCQRGLPYAAESRNQHRNLSGPPARGDESQEFLLSEYWSENAVAAALASIVASQRHASAAAPHVY